MANGRYYQVTAQVTKPEMYLTTEPQDDVPEARIALRLRCVVTIVGDRAGPTVIDQRGAWSAEHISSFRLALLIAAVRLVKRSPRIVGFLVKSFSNVVWKWES